MVILSGWFFVWGEMMYCVIYIGLMISFIKKLVRVKEFISKLEMVFKDWDLNII